MFDRLYYEIQDLEIEGRSKCARKSMLEHSIKSFRFINNNVQKIKCEHILSILGIIDNYFLGLEFPKKNIDYSNLEEKARAEYNKLITSSHFIEVKKENMRIYQKVNENELWDLENKFIRLAKSKKSRLNTYRGRKKFFEEFEEIYYNLISLLNKMTLNINHMYFIKNVLLFMKWYGLDKTQLINRGNVKEMLDEYNSKVNRK